MGNMSCIKAIVENILKVGGSLHIVKPKMFVLKGVPSGSIG